MNGRYLKLMSSKFPIHSPTRFDNQAKEREKKKKKNDF